LLAQDVGGTCGQTPRPGEDKDAQIRVQQGAVHARESYTGRLLAPGGLGRSPHAVTSPAARSEQSAAKRGILPHSIFETFSRDPEFGIPDPTS
jgi:hypothetical protein